jgi:hypothetical protein
VFPRGGEAGDLGEVAFTVLVVTGQMVGEFIDPVGDHFAEHGEERAGISDLLVDLWEAAFPLPPYKFAVVVQRAVAAAGRIRSGQVWVPGHSDRLLRTAGAVGPAHGRGGIHAQCRHAGPAYRRRGPADLAGVPEAHRVIEVPGRRALRGAAAIMQHGDVAVLDAHLPLVRPALFGDRSRQPRPRRPVTLFFLTGAGVADLDPAVVGEPAVIVVVVVCHRVPPCLYRVRRMPGQMCLDLLGLALADA